MPLVPQEGRARKDGVTARKGYQRPIKFGNCKSSCIGKRKPNLGYRFWSLYGEVQRADVLFAAWRRVKANGGTAGVDGRTIEDIAQDANSEKEWLEAVREELRTKSYQPQPVRRVYISEGRVRDSALGNSDGEFISHLIQGPFGIGSILIRLERAIQAFNSASFFAVIVIQ